MALGKVSWTFKDHDGEVSHLGLWTGVVTAGNLAGVLTDVGNLYAGLQGVSLCNIVRERLLVADSPRETNVPATSANAQREIKALVKFTDVLEYFDDPVNSIPNAGYGKSFDCEVPGVDLQYLTPNTDTFDLTQAPWDAFVTAFEALIKSPYGGDTQITEVQHVGRST